MARNSKIDANTELKGLTKAAVLLLSIDQQAASAILRELDTKTVEEVTRELASLGDVPIVVRNRVLNEFYSQAAAQAWVSEGGLEYARSLLMKSVDPKDADRILQQISQQ